MLKSKNVNGEEKYEVDEAIKRILISLFKPSNKWIKAARRHRDYPNEVRRQKQKAERQQEGGQGPRRKSIMPNIL